jgi:hypothetical protein
MFLLKLPQLLALVAQRQVVQQQGVYPQKLWSVLLQLLLQPLQLPFLLVATAVAALQLQQLQTKFKFLKNPHSLSGGFF